MSFVTVYTLPNCVQCDQTKKLLESEGVDFNEVDLSQDQEARDKVRDHWGFFQAPVVDTLWDRWSGFNPSKIKEVKYDIENEAVTYHSDFGS